MHTSPIRFGYACVSELIGRTTNHTCTLKSATPTRLRELFVRVANALPEEIRRRLVIENDEHSYSVADVLSIYADCGLPVVFDNLHHRANPSGEILELMPRVFKTWRKPDGRPKVHFSSQARGVQIGKHADWINPVEFKSMLTTWQSFGELDVMVEAKRKDAALKKALGQININ